MLSMALHPQSVAMNMAIQLLYPQIAAELIMQKRCRITLDIILAFYLSMNYMAPARLSSSSKKIRSTTKHTIRNLCGTVGITGL